MSSAIASQVHGLLSGLRFIGLRLSQERITQTTDELRERLQAWSAQALLPPNIAGPVCGCLKQFAQKAAGLGAVGVIGLLVTATMLLLTVDRSLT